MPPSPLVMRHVHVVLCSCVSSLAQRGLACLTLVVNSSSGCCVVPASGAGRLCNGRRDVCVVVDGAVDGCICDVSRRRKGKRSCHCCHPITSHTCASHTSPSPSVRAHIRRAGTPYPPRMMQAALLILMAAIAHQGARVKGLTNKLTKAQCPVPAVGYTGT